MSNMPEDEKIDLSLLKPGDPIAIWSPGAYGRDDRYELTAIRRLTATQIITESCFGPIDRLKYRRFYLKNSTEVGAIMYPRLVNPSCKGVKNQQARKAWNSFVKTVQALRDEVQDAPTAHGALSKLAIVTAHLAGALKAIEETPPPSLPGECHEPRI